MKRKNKVILGSVLLGFGITAVAARLVYNRIYDIREERIMTKIRSHLSQFGDIQVVYVNDFKCEKVLSGGAVMTDGRHFYFTYDKKENLIKEEMA